MVTCTDTQIYTLGLLQILQLFAVKTGLFFCGIVVYTDTNSLTSLHMVFFLCPVLHNAIIADPNPNPNPDLQTTTCK